MFTKANYISNMHIGQSGWIVHWAIMFSETSEAFVRGDYTFHPEKGGTVNVQIQMTEDGIFIVPNNSNRFEIHTYPVEHWNQLKSELKGVDVINLDLLMS